MYAIYARQSVDRPDSISIESQIEFCKYELRGEAYREYQDKGYSGKNTDRPQFQQLLSDIRKGEITKVIVYKLDRISRSILDFSTMMEMFQKRGVEFVSSTEKFDTSTPMGRAMLNICIVFAQLERETIQKRVTDAYISRSQKGFFMGGRVTYGYNLRKTVINGVKTSMYEAVPEEVEQIKLMYEMYANPHISYGDIMRYFDEKHMLDLRSKKNFCRAKIALLLRNPAYVKADEAVYEFFRSQNAEIINDISDFIGVNGCYYYTGQDTQGRKTATIAGNVLVLAPHEGIIPSAIWLKCRKKCMTNKAFQPGRKASKTWLAGKLKCSNCGYALGRRTFQTNPDKAYYFCTRKMKAFDCPGAGRIYADKLEHDIFLQIQEKLRMFPTLYGNDSVVENPQRTTLQSQLTQIEAEIAKLVDNMASADNVLMSFINRKARELDSNRQAVLKEIAKLSAESVLDVGRIRQISGYAEKWDTITLDDKRIVCDLLISVIHASNGKLNIKWKF